MRKRIAVAAVLAFASLAMAGAQSQASLSIEQQVLPLSELGPALEAIATNPNATLLATLPASYGTVKACHVGQDGVRRCRNVQVLESVLVVHQVVTP